MSYRVEFNGDTQRYGPFSTVESAERYATDKCREHHVAGNVLDEGTRIVSRFCYKGGVFATIQFDRAVG